MDVSITVVATKSDVPAEWMHDFHPFATEHFF